MPYFDHNATTPLSATGRAAWLRAADEFWQNPSSLYRAAAKVKIGLDAGRERLGQLLDVDPKRIVFTSGATEGASAIFSYWARTLPPDVNVAVNPTEHPCVVEAARRYFGSRVFNLPVTADGVVQIENFAAQLSREKIGAMAVMAANNETGVIQPWAGLAAFCRKQNLPFFCDATQWLGKLPASGFGQCDWVVGSAHKFGGPKGTGFLVRSESADDFSIFAGGAQEMGHRGGTENYPGVAAMVAALAEAEQSKVFLETERLNWRRNFEQAVRSAVPTTRIVAENADRLWNTVSLILPHAENHRWVTKLDKLGFQVSTGSACAAGKQAPSHVLAAIGMPAEEAKRVIRVSAGWETEAKDWDALVQALSGVKTELVPPANVIQL